MQLQNRFPGLRPFFAVLSFIIEAHIGPSEVEDFGRVETAVGALRGTVATGGGGTAGRFGMVISIGRVTGGEMLSSSQWRFAAFPITSASLSGGKDKGWDDASLDGAIFKLAKPARSLFWMVARLAA